MITSIRFCGKYAQKFLLPKKYAAVFSMMMTSFFIGGTIGEEGEEVTADKTNEITKIKSIGKSKKPIVRSSTEKSVGFTLKKSDFCAKRIMQSSSDLQATEAEEGNTERLLDLLFRGSAENDSGSHSLFCELEELSEDAWHESARWVRFEEDVEVGGDRWSKPFVGVVSLHALFLLRQHLTKDAVLLDVNPRSFADLVDIVADSLVEEELVDASLRSNVVETLLLRHVHQHEHSATLKRGLSQIGKKISSWRMEELEQSGETNSEPLPSSSENDNFKQNLNFAKKLAPGCEGSTSLVGGVDFLEKKLVSAFVRLSSTLTLRECSEVAVPTRFVFFMLGPKKKAKELREIGRAMEVIMCDDLFKDVAYRSLSRADLLAGFDEFLDEGIALPPSEWDPKIRIEPPKKIPSIDCRKKNIINQLSSEFSSSHASLRAQASSGSLKRGTPDETETVMTEYNAGEQELSNSHVSVLSLMDDLRRKQESSDETAASVEHEVDASLRRTGRIFGGLVADVKRKWPWYVSDFTDGLNPQCLAAVFYMFFACLAPIVTFGGLLGQATENHIAAFETILSGTICGTTYHMFSGQPITVIGSTGPVLIFEKIIYSFSADYNFTYLTIRFWIGVWTAGFLMLIVMFDLSALVQLITRFTEECFATLISAIFIFQSFIALYGIYLAYPISNRANLARNYNCTCDWKHLNEFEVNTAASNCRVINTTFCESVSGCQKTAGCSQVRPVPNVFFFSCLTFIGTCSLSFLLKNFRTSSFFPAKVRAWVGDFAVSISIFLMVLIDGIVGLPTPKLRVPQEFAPTRSDRGWIVNPFANPTWTIFASVFPAMLLAVLLFMDQQITAVIVNRREHKLTKGKGYHLDLFLLTLHVCFCATFGLPYFVAATVLSITHVNALRKQSETSAPGEQPRFLGLVEQRVTGIIVFALIGCAIPLRSVLKYIPMPVLYGVFLYMGLAALQTSQFYSRCLLIFMPVKYQPDAPYLRHMKTWRVHLFTGIQLTAFLFLLVVKNIKTISLLFILMLVIMILLRKLLDFIFTQEELKWLDDILPKNPLAVASENGKIDNSNGNTDDGGRKCLARVCPRWFGRRNQSGGASLARPPTIVVVSPSVTELTS